MVSSEADHNGLKSDLERIFQLPKDWQMLFNADKCAVLHLGKNNNFQYFMGASEIVLVEKEKDLGVIIDKSAKSSEQCTIAANSANKHGRKHRGGRRGRVPPTFALGGTP